ncbi:Hypothetical predicted protein [Olea europaea subsp. europaea]|uniref:Secreted protein n=1 Tax=Olea europaea subsp. europaea TaxID=158383 RepID=A0A8S0PD36_OLEEU|nr:Hypothetical predicted protein [Olea europaea subsp. europaea]
MEHSWTLPLRLLALVEVVEAMMATTEEEEVVVEYSSPPLEQLSFWWVAMCPPKACGLIMAFDAALTLRSLAFRPRLEIA